MGSGRDGTERGQPTYALGAVVRLTGLSAHTIRAWERRYGAVRPTRTPGGTRRYTPSDIARLRVLKAGVEAGHRIGEIAGLPDAEIDARLSLLRDDARPPLEELRAAIARLDAVEVERLLAIQCAVLGPAAFARDVAAPLLREVGDRWESGDLSVAAEHLVSSITRGILGAALRGSADRDAPRLLLATPEGERHELGCLIAAVTALASGAAPTYLGPDLPAGEVAQAARRIGAAAVALSNVHLPVREARRYVRQLRRQLPDGVALWVGGPVDSDGVAGAERLELADLPGRIAALRHQSLR